MRIPIDFGSEIPLYQQIEDHLRHGILSGGLAPETRLPATRQLARDLGVNRITVETAYQDLISDGLAYSRVGSGTFVQVPPSVPSLPKKEQDTVWPLWQDDILDVLKKPAHLPAPGPAGGGAPPNLISFREGIGDSRLFPVDDFRKTIQAVMRRDGQAALDYGEINGYAPLRATIAHILASQGIQTFPEQILITAGSQQALALVCQLLLKPGDAILVENPTYSNALDLFRLNRLKLVGAPVDRYGMQVEKLEKLLQLHHPRLIYTIPNFHNPTGSCMSLPRRHQLIALADRYNIPILEDDYVGDLRYDGRALPALKSLDPGGRVIYVSTFSKMLMPGLRVGFLAAEGPIYEALVAAKHINDLATSNLYQRAIEAYVTVGSYQAHLRRTCLVYRKRRDAMLEAVDRFMPAGVSGSPPQGGLFLWLQLPEGCASEDLLPIAREEGVAFSPGSGFFDRPDADGFMRLNFALQAPEAAEEGIRRLGKAVRRLASGR